MKSEIFGALIIGIIIITVSIYYWVQSDQMMREMDKQHIQ